MFLNDLIERYPVLAVNRNEIAALIAALIDTYENGGKLIVAGNGGSASDAEHICGELLKGFCSKRKMSAEDFAKLSAAGAQKEDQLELLQYGLPALSLLSHPALNSAFGNDVDPDLAFAQQLWAQGKAGDTFLAISTGGNASNLRKALITARAMKIKTALLTGNRHGVCEKYADIVIAVPEKETFKIQELHLPVYHTLCLAVEAKFFE
ncbi:MAG: SIS domain-containing protein [Lentisphaeria bacterium]|nr:SIS domain-containing protein [Lentisphaeria bacterium]